MIIIIVNGYMAYQFQSNNSPYMSKAAFWCEDSFEGYGRSLAEVRGGFFLENSLALLQHRFHCLI